MYPVELTRIGKLAQVPADGLWCHAEMLDKPFHRYHPIAAGDVDDLRLA